jgi:hypothetical protein
MEKEHENKENDKSVTIIVNTREHTWPKGKISFKEVVELAYGTYNENPDITYSVNYKRGDKEKPEGSLTQGKDVNVKEGMIFNVTQTNKS